MRGLLGKKIGMSRVFNGRGEVVPVTILNVGPCVVTQVKTLENDGYQAVQLGYINEESSTVDKRRRIYTPSITLLKDFTDYTQQYYKSA